MMSSVKCVFSCIVKVFLCYQMIKLVELRVYKRFILKIHPIYIFFRIWSNETDFEKEKIILESILNLIKVERKNNSTVVIKYNFYCLI